MMTPINPIHRCEVESAQRELVVCTEDSSLGEVMDQAVKKHVHRVWVVNQQGLLVGLVSLTDLIRVLRGLFLAV